MAATEFDLIRKIHVLVAIDKSEIDQSCAPAVLFFEWCRRSFSDPGEQGALLRTVAAPQSGRDEYVHVPREPRKHGAMLGMQFSAIMDARPVCSLIG